LFETPEAHPKANYTGGLMSQKKGEFVAVSFTVRQGQILSFIYRFAERHGVSPSFDEIAAHFGITSPSVNGMIRTLEKKGLLSRIPGAARTLRVEVPASSLPEIDFGRSPGSSRSKAQQDEYPSRHAASVAIAVLDGVMPWLLARGATQDEVGHAVQDAAAQILKTLKLNGAPPEDALAAYKSVVSEISRWQPSGRGMPQNRYVWKPG
jgi:hypothetical protein